MGTFPLRFFFFFLAEVSLSLSSINSDDIFMILTKDSVGELWCGRSSRRRRHLLNKHCLDFYKFLPLRFLSLPGPSSLTKPQDDKFTQPMKVSQT